MDPSMSESVLTTSEQVASIWGLGGLTWKQLGKRVWRAAMDSDLLGLASQLAYNFLLAVFPMLLFLVALFGVFASESTNLRQNLFYYFSQMLPPAAFQLVTKTLDEVTRNSGGGKLTFGILFALWASSGGMSSLISALNGAYNVRESRAWWKVR